VTALLAVGPVWAGLAQASPRDKSPMPVRIRVRAIRLLSVSPGRESPALLT
jgi:hypothetical protein